MGTKRRRIGRTWDQPVSDAVYALLQTGELASHGVDAWETLDMKYRRDDALREAWQHVRAALLKAWVQAHPGTRPWGWWRFDAPRAPLAARRRVGGTGTVSPGYVPQFAFGLPTSPHLDVDPNNPPTFESESAYLTRRRLLGMSERRRVVAAASQPAQRVTQ